MADPGSRTGNLPPGIEDAELIARGGFASVYRAWQPDFHRQVALKVLHADARDPAVRDRFDREVRAMGSVSDHPNVVPVYDAGVHDDRPYLVMPYLAGGSLADELRNGPLATDEALAVGRAVAVALDAAHRAGLLHRDVKPANILRTSYGEPKLADFGIARFADATATHGSMALTVAYAAPELLSGEPASVASDVYSLGATLHALLRGAPPFEAPEGAAPLAVAVRIASEPPPDLRDAGVPDRVAAVIERAMAKDPAARYPSAAAFATALGQLDGPDDTTRIVAPVDLAEPAPTRVAAPPPPLVRGPAVHRPNSWPLVAAAVVAVAVIAVALAAWARQGDDGGRTAVTSPAPTTTVAAETTVAPASETQPAPDSTVATTPADDEDEDEDDVEVVVGDRGDDAVDAAREYFAVLDAGDIDGGWQRLSPAYQDASGEDAYRGFWETIDAVEVLEAEPGSEDLTAVVTLRYVRTDGSTSTETNTLRFVEGDDGTLLVDGSS